MTRNLPQSTPASRTRVGVLGIVPMRVLGLQALFDDHPAIQIVHADILEILRDSTVQILILGARSEASLGKLMTIVKSYRADMRVLVMSSASDEGSILKAIASGATAVCLAQVRRGMILSTDFPMR